MRPAVASAAPLPHQRAVVALCRAPFEHGRGRARELFAAVAKEREVVYVEEPVAAEPGVPDSWEIQFAAPRLVVCRPLLRGAGGGYAGAPLVPLASMIRKLLRWQGIEDFMAWIDTPHAFSTAQRLGASFLVYSCANVLWGDGEPADSGLLALEADVVRAADLVLVSEPGLERQSGARAAARILADLSEAERAPRALRRPRALRAAAPSPGTSVRHRRRSGEQP
jgi:hypothetical protein